ncbi:MAG: glycosyltransferase family 2 protein [Myxococcota bacterium]
MKHAARVAVVMPAHNEARLIGAALASIPAWVDDVIVVDDGSTDGTAAAARASGEPRVQVLRHDHNRGVGAALTSGYRAAFAAGADVAVVMAGDGQMHPEDLPALLAPALDGAADYVKGNRLSHPAVRRVMPGPRWVGNQVLSWLTRRATGLALHDSQCGYTVLTRRAAERLPLEDLWSRYGYPNDLLGLAAATGMTVRDVTVRPVYGTETSGVRWWHAALVIPALLVRVAVRRWRARLLGAPVLPPASPARHGTEGPFVRVDRP